MEPTQRRRKDDIGILGTWVSTFSIDWRNTHDAQTICQTPYSYYDLNGNLPTAHCAHGCGRCNTGMCDDGRLFVIERPVEIAIS